MTVKEVIIRQASIFDEIEEFIRSEQHEQEYGYNIPMEYDIIISIYHEVNEDLRRGGLILQNDLIYTTRKRKHGKPRRT